MRILWLICERIKENHCLCMLLKGGVVAWWSAPDRMTDGSCVQTLTHHHLVLGHPAVGREVLQHGHQELQAAVPVTQQQHHSNQVDDSHHCAGQVVGHMKNLKKAEKEGQDMLDTSCHTLVNLNVTDIWNRAEYHWLPHANTHTHHTEKWHF